MTNRIQTTVTYEVDLHIDGFVLNKVTETNVFDGRGLSREKSSIENERLGELTALQVTKLVESAANCLQYAVRDLSFVDDRPVILSERKI